MLVGGYHGGWVPWTAATPPRLPLPGRRWRRTARARAPASSSRSAPAAAALRAGAEIAAYLAGQSAGQCGPCLNGLPGVGRSARAAWRPGRADRRRSCASSQRIAGLVEGRGACHHPDGTARLVRSTLRAFAAEVELHLAGRCTAAGYPRGAAAMTARGCTIDWTRCDGRGLCPELLPELLAADDWGYPLSRTGDAAPARAERLRAHAERAVRECPRLALRIRPDPRGPGSSAGPDHRAGAARLCRPSRSDT